MAIFAVASVSGAPGTTALAVDLANALGPEALLIEADPDGGCLAARLDLPLRPGLTEMAGAARTGIRPGDLWRFAQSMDPTIPGGAAVVVAHPAAEQVHAAFRAAASNIAAVLGTLGQHVVVDIGRLRPGSPALSLAAAADVVLVMSDNAAEAIVTLAHRGQLLQGLTATIVLNDSKPYRVDEIADATRQHVWGAVPRGGSRRGNTARSAALQALINDFVTDDVLPDLGTAEDATRDVETEIEAREIDVVLA